MKDHGGMNLADYLVSKLQDGKKFKVASTRWDAGDTVTTTVTDEHGRMWNVEIWPSPDDDT